MERYHGPDELVYAETSPPTLLQSGVGRVVLGSVFWTPARMKALLFQYKKGIILPILRQRDDEEYLVAALKWRPSTVG